jgi:hypothetical protein
MMDIAKSIIGQKLYSMYNSLTQPETGYVYEWEGLRAAQEDGETRLCNAGHAGPAIRIGGGAYYKGVRQAH